MPVPHSSPQGVALCFSTLSLDFAGYITNPAAGQVQPASVATCLKQMVGIGGTVLTLASLVREFC